MINLRRAQPSTPPFRTQLVGSSGEEARVFLLKCLVDSTGVATATDPAASPDNPEQLVLLAQLLLEAAAQPHCVSLLCRALGVACSPAVSPKSVADVDTQQQQQPQEQLLATLARNLKLAPAQEAALSVGLARSPAQGVAKVRTDWLSV